MKNDKKIGFKWQFHSLILTKNKLSYPTLSKIIAKKILSYTGGKPKWYGSPAILKTRRFGTFFFFLRYSEISSNTQKSSLVHWEFFFCPLTLGKV